MHVTKVGGMAEAFEHLQREGGQLYTAKTSQGSNSLIQGRNVTTYWEENSTVRKAVIRLSTEWNLPPEHQTFGRLAKWYVKNILELPYQGTYFSKHFQNLARDGSHWHYLYHKKGEHGYCFEWDLKSAYVTSLFQGRTLLYDQFRGYIDDNGALETLKNSVHLLPKDFRLVLIGVLSTYQRRYWIRTDKETDGVAVKQLTTPKVVYYAAFNAVHGAIYRLYMLMRKLHEIGGEYIVRCHTDSILIREDIPASVLSRLAEHILKNGHQITVKAEGRCYLFDLDCGFIGNKPLGGTKMLIDAIKREKVALFDQKLGQDVKFIWQKYKKHIPDNFEELL